MIKKIIFLLGVVTFASGVALAEIAPLNKLESIYFNAGTHTEFANYIQSDTSGGVRKLDFSPTLGAGLAIPFPQEVWKIMPEFNWVLPRYAGSSRIIKNLFMVRADVSYDPIEWLRLRAGTSLMFKNQYARGGSVQLNNGNGKSTFYYPDEDRTSLNNTLDFGIEGLYKEWSLRFQTYTYSLFKSESRQLSYSLFVTYYWKQ